MSIADCDGLGRRRSSDAVKYLVPFGVGGVAAAIAWVSFGRTNLSLDEGYTASEATLRLPALLHVLWGRELNASLHTGLVWAITQANGRYDASLTRSLSTIFVVVALALLYPLLREIAGTAIAAASLCFVAANPFILEQMVNGRTYALTTALVVISLRVLLTAARRQSLASSLAWGSTCGVMLYAHFLTGPIVAAEALWLLGTRPRVWRVWTAGIATTCGMAIPILVFLTSTGGQQRQLPPSPTKSIHDYVSGALALVAGGAKGDRPIQTLATLLVALCLGFGLMSRRSRSMTALGSLVVFFPFAFAAVAAHSKPSIFAPEYLIIALPGLAMVVAAGAHALCSHPAIALRRLVSVLIPLLIVLTAGVASAVTSYRSATASASTRYAWSTAAARIVHQAPPGSLVTTMDPFEGFVARIYVHDRGLRFSPNFPRSGSRFLAESTYVDKVCLARRTAAKTIWILTAMSPHFGRDLALLAACSHLAIRSESSVGYVRIAELVQG